MAVVSASKSNGWRKVATTSPSSQVQFDSTKLSAWKTFARCSLSYRKSDAYRHTFRNYRQRLPRGRPRWRLRLHRRCEPEADANRQLSIPSSHRNAVRASQATARFVAATKAEGKADMKKCGAQNPITALDGALSCAYLDVRSTVDAWRDARCLAQVLHWRAHRPKRGST